MFIGLFIYAGWLIRVAWDFLDKGIPMNFISPEGKKNIKFTLLSFIISTLFYVIQYMLKFEDNFTNDWQLAILYLFFVFIGYFPTHFFQKLMSTFEKKTDERLI